jgi:superfamily I DNA and/or RNA helicase
MLVVQHRMHEALMAFPSARFYDGRLIAHGAVRQRRLAIDEDPILLPERPLDVIDTAGTGHEEGAAEGGVTKENVGEAALVARVLIQLVARGVAPADIGVVTPYAGQVALLHAAVPHLVDEGLEIDSVDGFQGREKDVIVLSAVRSNAAGEVGFLADARRLNVAITRAKRKLIVVGDSATLSTDEHWRALFEHAIAAGAYRSAFELPQD